MIKSIKILFHTSFWALLLITIISTGSLHAQQNQSDQPAMNITSGSVLTGFSAGWTGASRDSYNHEFERGFRQFSIGTDALYFFTDGIGIGPDLEYRYLYRDLEDAPGSGENDAIDRWNWDFKYGVKAGWFAPVKEIFGASSLGNSMVFVTGGVNWLRTQQKTEGFSKFDPNTRFGYTLSTGMLVPLGRSIGLEWKLQWEARRQTYSYGEIVDGNFVQTDENTGWPSTLSLGVGLKVKL